MNYNWDALFGKLKVDSVSDRGYVYLSDKKIVVSFFISDLDFFLKSDEQKVISFTWLGADISFSDLNYEQQRSVLEYFKSKVADIKIPSPDEKLRALGVIV